MLDYILLSTIVSLRKGLSLSSIFSNINSYWKGQTGHRSPWPLLEEMSAHGTCSTFFSLKSHTQFSSIFEEDFFVVLGFFFYYFTFEKKFSLWFFLLLLFLIFKIWKANLPISLEGEFRRLLYIGVCLVSDLEAQQSPGKAAQVCTWSQPPTLGKMKGQESPLTTEHL